MPKTVDSYSTFYPVSAFAFGVVPGEESKNMLHYTQAALSSKICNSFSFFPILIFRFDFEKRWDAFHVNRKLRLTSYAIVGHQRRRRKNFSPAIYPIQQTNNTIAALHSGGHTLFLHNEKILTPFSALVEKRPCGQIFLFSPCIFLFMNLFSNF